MPELVDALALALRDRYRVERELGVGGMATVCLAHDVRHHRRIALEVLREELGAALGAERFLRHDAAVGEHPTTPLYETPEAVGDSCVVL
jgi:serine/threonine-protein kinase